MSSSYNPWLVLFSIGIAFFASYIALDLASRVIHSTGRAMVIWLIGGSFSMGVGIWAMHFIGMLAFHLPIPLAYNIPLTLASIIPAIAASAIALWTVRNGHQNAQTTFVAAIVIGSGISVMHYMGMAALKMQPSIEYTPLLTVLSVMIAIAASLAALKIIFTLNSNPGPKSTTLLKLASAALMAIAISGMHYTGMAAANFPVNGMCRSSPQDLSSGWMALLIGGGSLMLMLTTLLISIFDARLADQNSRMVKQFKEINSELLSYIKAIGQHAMITVTDKAGRILQANDKFCEISGFSQQALYGHDYRLVNSGVHSSLFFVELWATIVRGDIWRGEICNRAKDGTLYWVDTAIVPLKDSNGEIERYISVTIDITKSKQAEHELTRLGRVLDESSNEIYVFDAQTLHFTLVNAEAQRNLGYAMDELKALTVLNLEPNLTHKIFEQRIALLRLGKQDVVIYETEHQRKDKSRYPIEIHLHLSAKENPPVFVAIIQDITQRQKIERMKNDFISTVSHELRTPLTSIRGALGLVAGGVTGELPTQAKMLVDIAHKNSERLILLVNDILDMEKIEAGKMDIQCKPVELMPLLHQALDANCAYGEQFNVSYELENEVPGIMVNVDANRLMQVMANLLSNAAKFSFAGDKVIVAVIASGNRVRVAVKDHGSGIAEPFRSQVFQKFAQSDSSDTRNKSGTGLGLAITRAIVEKMGGIIGFSSEPNVLTTFFIEFPIGAKIADVSSDKTEEKTKRILICEDDRLIAALLHFMLEQDGFVADVAYDTVQAKHMLAQHHYAAMTLDLSLPGQDGIAFIRELRMEEKTVKLPIVVVSARAIAGSLELNGEAYSIIDWITKPIDKEQMVLAIRRAVGRFSGIRPRVLHVEDDPDIFKVMHGLVGDMADLDHAGMLADARHLLKQCRYDLVILDLTLPDGSGQELLSILNGATPPIPVMVFSAREVGREEIRNVASLMVKSRTSDAQLLATIKRLIGVE